MNKSPARITGPKDKACTTMAAATALALAAPKNDVMPNRYASWKLPTPPGVGTATPITRSDWIKKEPGNGSAMPNARVTAQISAAPRIQIGSDHEAASTNSRGRLVTTSPLLNRLAM